MSFLFPNKPKVKSNTTVGITESGKREAERNSSRGDAFAVLAALDEQSPQTISRLAEEVHMTTGEVLQRLKILSQQGYVRFISGVGIEG